MNSYTFVSKWCVLSFTCLKCGVYQNKYVLRFLCIFKYSFAHVNVNHPAVENEIKWCKSFWMPIKVLQFHRK